MGRLAEMWALDSALQAGGLGLITGATDVVAQLQGLGGVGKSLHAEEYALRFCAAYPGGVFWLRALWRRRGQPRPGAARGRAQRPAREVCRRVTRFFGRIPADLRQPVRALAPASESETPS